MGLLTVLTLILLTLKLVGIFSLSWWIVFLPMGIEVLISVAGAVMGIVLINKQ